jgi:predicted N-acetyltransferase YhbS
LISWQDFGPYARPGAEYRFEALQCAPLAPQGTEMLVGHATHMEAQAHLHSRVGAKPTLRGYIGSCAVEPGIQRSGLGTRLVQECLKVLADMGCTAVDLVVVNRVSDRLLPFYTSKFGFNVVGAYKWEEHKEVLSDPTISAFILLSKNL